MSIDQWQPFLRGTKIAIFLLATTMLSLIMTTLLSRPTQAESFLYKTTCNVVGLLGLQCKTTPITPTPTSPAPSTPSEQTPPTAPAESTHETPAAPQTTPIQPIEQAPLETIDVPDQAIQPIADIPTNATYRSQGSTSQFALYASPMITSGNSPEILGSITPTPLQPSTNGWKFFGIAWYWVLLALSIIFWIGAGINRQFSDRRQKSV